MPITNPTITPGPGRKPTITRADLINAALGLLGPHRSVSTLSLREIARAAQIAPNSFYRHFRDVDELAVTLIEQTGSSLRSIIGQARHRVTPRRSVVRSSVETFFEQLRADDRLLHLLLREGSAGSDAFKDAVERQLRFFEDELCLDLIRLAKQANAPLHRPELVARAITRLVFAIGASAMDLPPERDPELIRELSTMVRMIILGARALSHHTH